MCFLPMIFKLSLNFFFFSYKFASARIHMLVKKMCSSHIMSQSLKVKFIINYTPICPLHQIVKISQCSLVTKLVQLEEALMLVWTKMISANQKWNHGEKFIPEKVFAKMGLRKTSVRTSAQGNCLGPLQFSLGHIIRKHNTQVRMLIFQ